MAKIVHFAKYFAPDSGGIESVTFSTAKGAVSAGHEVAVVCFSRDFLYVDTIIDCIRVLRMPISTLVSSQPISFSYFLKCILIARNADLVHLHAPNMLAALCALFIPKKVPLLVHWHSDVVGKGYLAKVFRPLEFLLLLRADSIVVTSQAYADSSASLKRFLSKIAVVPIGVVDVNRVESNIQASSTIHAQLDQKRIILAVGRLVEYKGFQILIEAVRYLQQNAHVVIVGDGPLYQELKNLIEIRGLDDRIVLAGRVSESMLKELYSQAYIFCLSSISRAEAFGVVLLEAMAHGVPIVASDIAGSGVPWVNLHGLSGFNFPAGDPEALAEACNLILSSPELRDKLAAGARQRFLDRFTERESINRLLVTYDGLLAINRFG
jgi:glycosyltransferase involved in cell wall biosynthesis